MRYLQVVVWKRVKEINENLIDRATSVSVILITQALGLLCNPEYKLLVAVSTFSKQPASAPFSACQNDIDPFHQKISIRAHVVAGNVNFIFTGFQQPVSRRLESSSWGDEVAEKAEA